VPGKRKEEEGSFLFRLYSVRVRLLPVERGGKKEKGKKGNPKLRGLRAFAHPREEKKGERGSVVGLLIGWRGGKEKGPFVRRDIAESILETTDEKGEKWCGRCFFLWGRHLEGGLPSGST